MPALKGPVAARMQAGVNQFLSGPAPASFVTPMAAVAGAVADHVLAAMTAAAGPGLPAPMSIMGVILRSPLVLKRALRLGLPMIGTCILAILCNLVTSRSRLRCRSMARFVLQGRVVLAESQQAVGVAAACLAALPIR